jgi:hypothetical protein
MNFSAVPRCQGKFIPYSDGSGGKTVTTIEEFEELRDNNFLPYPKKIELPETHIDETPVQIFPSNAPVSLFDEFKNRRGRGRKDL